MVLAWVQRLLSGGARYVPRGSWSVFHPKIKLPGLHPVEKLDLQHSVYITHVQAHVPLSRLQTNIMRWGTVLAVSSAVYQFMTNLHSVPITGRTQVVALSQEEEFEMGNAAAEKEIQNSKLIVNGPRLRMCVDVAARLVSVSEHLFPRQYDWRVWLVDAPGVANACCFPGGKMIVYSGILDVIDVAVAKGLVDNKHDALAVILSHEISHALARHTAERMSYLPLLYAQAVFGMESPLLQYVFEFAMNLPFSRKQEVEADHIGIMLMASACYDPATAPKFWKAFGRAMQGNDADGDGEDDDEIDFDFFSTHPSNKKRERVLESLVAQALQHQARASWCFQVKERVQQLMFGTPADNEFLQRIRLFQTRQTSALGKPLGGRRNTVGTVHELENEEIYRAIRTEQERLRLEAAAASAPATDTATP